jgi:glycosyltransferase involved in cell wall biosynthesis
MLVNPFDTDAIGAGLARLIDDEDLRATLRQRGLERAARFNWRDTARQTLQVYEQATGGRMRDEG